MEKSFITGSKLTIDELTKNIKDAFNKADSGKPYCDTYIYAVSHETGQVTMTLREIKPDLVLLKTKLKEVFRELSYEVSFDNSGSMIIINKRSVM